MEWIKGQGHKAYEVDGVDDEDDDVDVGDVEENDVGMMKLKATESIFIWYIRGGEGEIKKGHQEISHIAHITQFGYKNLEI